MQELKPVPVGSIRVDIDGAQLRLSGELPPGKNSLYTLPATHRIVSAELLERAHQFAAVAAEHYSGMNDEVCQSYSEPWQQGVALSKELRAIIDKGPTA